MMIFSRADDSVLSRWWWTVDRWLLLALLMLLAAGVILGFAAGTSAATRLGLPAFYFAERQVIYALLALVAMVGLSLLPARTVRRFALILLGMSLLATAATLFADEDYNGATRWLDLGGLSIQPSEFLKPALAVTCAWLLAAGMEESGIAGRGIAAGLVAVAAVLLLLQPDFGQTVLIGATFALQLVLAGLPGLWIAALGAASVLGVGAAYVLLPHVAERITRFLDPASGDTWQVDRALTAFRAGGLFGRGPGEGAIKKHLPEAHTDYIFAVAGEEFGALACLAIIALFAVIVVRGLMRLGTDDDPFRVLATSGLLAVFGFQALINIGVNLALLPSKGMTLPFISYGGSSMLALGITMGMVLALTRRNRFEGRSRFTIRRWA